eukprot:15683264-Heterocapsa_arctica.AAC.1
MAAAFVSSPTLPRLPSRPSRPLSTTTICAFTLQWHSFRPRSQTLSRMEKVFLRHSRSSTIGPAIPRHIPWRT